MSKLNKVFFSDENLKLIFGVINKNIINQTNYDLSNNEKISKIFVKMAKIVYNNMDSQNQNLQYLNTTLVEKSVPHFIKILNSNKTKNKNTNKLIRNIEEAHLNTRPKVTMNDSSVTSQFNSLENERKNLINGKGARETQIPLTSIGNPNFDDPLSNKKQITNDKNTNIRYTELMNSRKIDLSDTEKPNLNVMSYDDQAIAGLTMQNVNNTEYKSNIDTKTNPMDLYEKQSSQRQLDEKNYLSYIENQSTFDSNVKDMENRDGVNLEQINNERREEKSGFYDNLKYNSGNLSEPDKLPFFQQEFKDKTPNFKLRDELQDNDNRIIEQNPNYELFKKDMFGEKNYIEKTHYINVGSVDRNWVDNRESRYNYTVKFEPTDSTTNSNAYIKTKYKNVISIELVKAFVALDNTPIPMDKNMYIGVQSNPYLILKIDEIPGVYSGTNDSTNNAFAHLCFDKEYKTTTLNDSTNNASDETATFDKQFIRGFNSYIPLAFEKKSFYPSPLSVLNSLTINLMACDGTTINNLRDNLEISEIDIVSADIGSSLQYSAANGFPKPNNDDDTNFYLIKITTSQKFSYKNFKVGDKVLMKNCSITKNTSSSSTDGDYSIFQDFINRDEGHYIINIEKLTHVAKSGSFNQNTNEGYVNTLYIAPMGNFKGDGTLEKAHPNTEFYSDAVSNIPTISSMPFTESIGTESRTYLRTPSLLNLSMQNNFIFRIKTRERDTVSQMNIVNI